MTGRTPSVVEGVGRLFLTSGGVVIGLAIGAAVAWFERLVDDGPIEIVISILVPYATYLIGDRAHVSGVIAVIACSMYMRPQEFGVHVTSGAAADDSGMGRADVRAERDCVCVDRAATAVCDGPDQRHEPRRAGGVWGWLQRCNDRGTYGMGIRRNLYRLRGEAVGAEGRGRGAGTTKIICDWVGWDAAGYCCSLRQCRCRMRCRTEGCFRRGA